MDSQLLPIAGTLTGVLIGAIATFANGVRRSRDLERQARAHLASGIEQQKILIYAEQVREQRKRIEESYAKLMSWLHDLERTIDEIWDGIYMTDNQGLTRVKHILDQWPWETLRVPRDLSFAEIYWSIEIRSLLRRFSGKSSRYVLGTRMIIEAKIESNVESDDDSMQQRTEMWDERGRLLGVIDEIRKQVRTELAPGSDSVR
jgi:YD repeat-containing protein